MEIKWLEDFLSLAETGSFSRSAEERHVTQPAFSRRIKALEAWLGVELVDRSAYPATLTPAGIAFREAAKEMLHDLYETRATLRGQQPLPDNTVQFAVAHTLSITYFPKWLKQLEQEFNPVISRVVATNVHDGVTALVEGGCDLLLAYHHPHLPLQLDESRFAFVPLGAERVLPYSACDRDGNPLFRLPGKTGRPVPFLAYAAGAFLAHVVEMILQNAPERYSLQRCFETHMSEALKAMVVEGHGLAWLPESSVTREVASRRLACAGSEAWSAQLDIRIYRALDNRKPAVEKLWTFVNKQLTGRAA
ncbi:MAG: LysR family transcriptional regulator [Betaproteobacteria bacterium]|nr:LysR family transcriptional regulator [Betaproteobacteria bacterium]